MSSVIPRPDNPGSYMSLTGEATVRPPSSIAEVVAIPIVHDWGPLGAEGGVISLQEFSDFDAEFGNSVTAGRNAVQGAFTGPGTTDKPAAGEVKVYRMGTSSAAAATVTIKNTAGSPLDALKLTAKYKGARGNRFSIKTEDDPLNALKDKLWVLFDGVKQEYFSYTEANITEAAEIINARSAFITAEMKATGTKLATTAGTALATGNNGESLTGAEWTAALDALEFESFSVFAPFDLTAEAIIASVYSWTQTQYEQQRPITTVLGGSGTETLEKAMEEVGKVRDPHVIRLTGGKFHDDFLDADVTTSQLAPRVAGALAGCGEDNSLTMCPFAGLSQVGTVNIGTSELKVARESGLTVFRRASRADGAEMVIAAGVTTFNSQTDPTRPYELFSDPRIVRVHDFFRRRMAQYGNEKIIGPANNETNQAAVRQRGTAEINDLLDRGLILPGESADERPYFRIVKKPGANLKDAIVYEFGWTPARTTNFLIGLGKVK